MGQRANPSAEYPPISDHGIIGDLRTCALVDDDATIDWFCAGRFDRPSVFGSILDPDAGSWTVQVIDGATRTAQFYFPESAVLVTRFLTEEGVAEVYDFMPLVAAHEPDHHQRIVRRVTCVRGQVKVRTVLRARPDYGRAHPGLSRAEGAVLIEAPDLRLALTATHDVEVDVDEGSITAELTMGAGEEARFTLHVLEDEDDLPDDTDVDDLFDRTTAFWQGWLSQSTYAGRWREMVDRSAITLKLLTHEPTGAIIASPTTSLPEEIGGGRNWDYRFVWIRDAGFSLYALLRLGFTDEAAAFMAWLSRRLGDQQPARPEGAPDLGPLRVLYDIDGNVPDAEYELDHLRGYRDSQPVRVGNAAVDQLQLDIYGEIIDSVYLFNKYGAGISHDAWADLTRVIEWVIDNWEQDDAGMWEIRDEPRPHTTSRLMCWVAIERMMRMARQRGLPGDLSEWGRVRDEIYHRIMDHSWDPEVGAFMATEGGSHVDAGVLLMPLVKFVAPNDPRFLSTLDVIEERLVGDSLVFRYDLGATTDGLDGPEGTFSLCSFWYVEALTRAGRLDDARLALEKMFTYANHLGLYAEQVGLTGQQLGNFPQAFTHLSLISAAMNLDARLDARLG
jgi:GH15 family glucan-1,4-alpha-glucosidase